MTYIVTALRKEDGIWFEETHIFQSKWKAQTFAKDCKRHGCKTSLEERA